MENGLNSICKDLIKDNIPSPARLSNSANCGAKYTYIKGYKRSSYAICRNKKMYGDIICN